MSSLEELLDEAAAASPLYRIEYRDRIAEYGLAALAPLEPWLLDPQLARFAARVVAAVAARDGSGQAVASLVSARDAATDPGVRNDLEAVLAPFLVRAPARTGGRGYTVLDWKATLQGARAVRYRIAAHRQRGHFNVPRDVMNELGIPTDGNVDLLVRRVATGGVIFEGRVGLASGTEVYPVGDDPSMRELSMIAPYEELEVTVARQPGG